MENKLSRFWSFLFVCFFTTVFVNEISVLLALVSLRTCQIYINVLLIHCNTSILVQEVVLRKPRLRFCQRRVNSSGTQSVIFKQTWRARGFVFFLLNQLKKSISVQNRC